MVKKHFKKLCFLIVFCAMVHQSKAQQKKREASVIKSGQYFEIEVADNVLQIDPSTGGRITCLSHGNINFLTDSCVNSFNYGSTFWLSPQSDWDWPPSAEIDNKPYSVKLIGNSLRLTSQKDAKTGIVVQKEFSGSMNRDCFTIKYTITNYSSEIQKVAPWEVTRVHINGIALFPMGNGDMWGGLLSSVKLINHIGWFVYDISKLPLKDDRQIYTDGAEGWLAEMNGRWLLVQQSPELRVEDTAPNEGEVELYASPVKDGSGYVEIEHQGEYKNLKPGESTLWEIHWYLREIPLSISPVVGNDALVNLIRQMIK
jgi:hypothetical protein